MLVVNLHHTTQFLQSEEWQSLQPSVTEIHKRLLQGDVPGHEYLGWLRLPSQILAQDLTELQAVAAEIHDQADALVVVGVGGSYLGASAAFEWVKPAHYNLMSRAMRGGPEIYFAGHHLSGSALSDLLRILEGKKVYINVISKSGGTTEPAVTFRLLESWLVRQIGETQAARQTIVTTDAKQGTLRQLARQHGFRTFSIPPDVGGRYSVLTTVGLLPLAAIGLDIFELLRGALEAEDWTRTANLRENPAYLHAAVRQTLYRRGKTTEILAYYEPGLMRFAEWWKQLYAESEGKNGRGIFPAIVNYTTDLHSIGQYIQEGRRHLFETVLHVTEMRDDVVVPQSHLADGLEFLSGRSFGWMNEQARLATQLAHADGDVPNILIEVKDRSERSLGELFYFFELSCAMSSLLMEVNPFDQPGVESYKRNLFALLGKPGFDDVRRQIDKRMEVDKLS